MTPVEPWSQWHGHALIVGGGGIGRALQQTLNARAPDLQVSLATRRPRSDAEWLLDLCDDQSLQCFEAAAVADLKPLRLVINTAGVLHGPQFQPEKRLAAVTRTQLEQSFAINAFAPILLARCVAGAIDPTLPSHFASLSARVGSIGDNRSGGWYSYRAAKAAQNQLLRTLALEWGRRLPHCCVSLLHPGTTATGLSEPFRGSVKPASLFSPEQAAGYLLDVLAGLDAQQSGRFWAWDGTPIPW